MSKYTEEMVNAFNTFGTQYNDEEIPYEDTVQFLEDFNNQFEVEYTQRSINSKLRHMGFSVAKKPSFNGVKKYSAEEEDTIRELAAKDGIFIEDIAEALGREAKSIGGKLVSMGLYGIKKKNHKTEIAPKTFTEAEESVIREMTSAGECFIEDIAERLGKGVQQVRGKLAGMRIKGVKTRNLKAPKQAKIYTDEVLAEIKEAIANGQSPEQIAKDRDLNLHGLILTLKRKGIIEKTSKAKKVFWTDERIEELHDLATEGKTMKQAAEALGTRVTVVGKKAKALGLEFAK